VVDRRHQCSPDVRVRSIEALRPAVLAFIANCRL
jgi:hypothetical protein